MTIVESILTQNDCYKKGRTIEVKGLMLHSVGCPQPSAKVFVNNWNRSGLEKCVHGFIDANDGKVYQTLPWNHRGWHAGTGTSGKSANNTHIGVEMCEPSQIKYTGGATFTVTGNKDNAIAMVDRTYKSAVELFAQLCVKYNLNPAKDIISHSEGHAQGIASNHGDPVHLWKQLGLKYTMDGFRSDVAKEVDKIKGVEAPAEPAAPSEPEKPAATPAEPVAPSEPEKPADTPVEPERPATPAAPSEPELPFLVKVSVDNLRIRKGPGTNNATTGHYTGIGVFTIVEVQNGTGSTAGWGRLKSGAGWISLDYAKRI